MTTRKYVSFWDRDLTGWVERSVHDQPRELRTPTGILVDVALALSSHDSKPPDAATASYILWYRVLLHDLEDVVLAEDHDVVEFPRGWEDDARTDDPDDHLHAQLDAALPALLAHTDKMAQKIIAALTPHKQAV